MVFAAPPWSVGLRGECRIFVGLLVATSAASADGTSATATAVSPSHKGDSKACNPCESEPEPAPGEFAGSLNGIRWPTLCVDDRQPNRTHFFAIADWGGVGKYPPKPFNNTKGKRPFVSGVDDQAQILVAAVMKNVSRDILPQFVINAGGNFFPAGLESTCGVADMCHLVENSQWHHIYEWVYDNPELHVPWMGILGNQDWGGNRFNKGWDQLVAYTWHSGRWRVPAFYWQQRVQYCNFSADFFFLDTAYLHAVDTKQDLEHNICSKLHNVVSDCHRADGPKTPEECIEFFRKLRDDQRAWLEKRLQESDATWQIIVMHFPPQWDLDYWEEVSAKYGVDLLISGHRHQQEVHYNRDSGHLTGTAWIVTGGGGGITSEGNPNFEGSILQQYGFMDIALSEKDLVVDMWSYTGRKTSRTTVVPRLPTAEEVAAQHGAPISVSTRSTRMCLANKRCVLEGHTEGNCCPNDHDEMFDCCTDSGGADEAPARMLLRERSSCDASRRRGKNTMGSERRRRAQKHLGLNCWDACQHKAGLCEEFCGDGNACCRFNFKSDPGECLGVLFPTKAYHTCVMPIDAYKAEDLGGVVKQRPLPDGLSEVPIYANDSSADVLLDLAIEDCLPLCGHAGMCEHICGAGKACCKQGDSGDLENCRSAFGFVTGHHECVMVMGKEPNDKWGTFVGEVETLASPDNDSEPKVFGPLGGTAPDEAPSYSADEARRGGVMGDFPLLGLALVGVGGLLAMIIVCALRHFHKNTQMILVGSSDEEDDAESDIGQSRQKLTR